MFSRVLGLDSKQANEDWLRTVGGGVDVRIERDQDRSGMGIEA